MASRELIDMSALPVPDAVVVPAADTIFAQWLSRLRTLDPDFNALVESDPAYKQGEVNAFQVTLLMQRVNDAVRAVLLASSAGNDLDHLGAGFEVPRKVLVPADPNAIPPVEAVLETDDDFRRRIQSSWGRLSTAGALDAYRFFTASASPDTLDVRPYGPEDHNKPGEVHIYVLSRLNAGVPSAALLATVLSSVSGDDVRPLTDYVTAYPATIIPFEVEADILLPYGLDNDMVMDMAREALARYLDLTYRIGVTVSRSGIFSMLHQKGVATVHLRLPADDREMGVGEVGRCTAIRLNKVVVDGD